MLQPKGIRLNLLWAMSCFPVPFDHFFFKVDKETYAAIKKSDYFSRGRLSFFEPDKNPFGTHRAHYIHGNLSYLEIFSEEMAEPPADLGIGFLSEKAKCLEEIHKRLSKKASHTFILKSPENWGRYTDFKSPKLWVWVSELKSSYVNDRGRIDRGTWIQYLRRTNHDSPSPLHLQEFEEIHWILNAENTLSLRKIFESLDWKVTKSPSSDAFKAEAYNQRVHVWVGERKFALERLSLRLKGQIDSRATENLGSLKVETSPTRLSIETLK